VLRVTCYVLRVTCYVLPTVYNNPMPENQISATPMMKQYLEIKSRYPDTILFFRLGDFYEMFQEDAKIGSSVLNITLTSRDKGQDTKVPMCGVPYHAAESYIIKLVKAGYKVAICEQVTKPQKGVSIVKREVVRVVTPSSVLSDTSYEASSELLLTFNVSSRNVGLSLVSLQSGDVFVSNESISNHKDPVAIVEEYILRYQPAEVLLPRGWYEDSDILFRFKRQGVNCFVFDAPDSLLKHAQETVLQYYGVATLESFGIDKASEITNSLAIALSYISETQKQTSRFLRYPSHMVSKDYMLLSGQTISNLELFATKRTGSKDVSLFSAIDGTKTVMGRRLLTSWIMRPLFSIAGITERLDVVSFFVDHPQVRKNLAELLAQVSDIERSISRLSVGVATARDAKAIGDSLSVAHRIKEVLENMQTGSSKITSFCSASYWDALSTLVTKLAVAISDDPPAIISDGGMFRTGYNARLDELRSIKSGGTDTLQMIENRERSRTGILSLKVRFNKVFGYYIEVSKSNIDNVPADYIRRQTLANAERYIIPELKEYEDTVLSADYEIVTLEKQLFIEIVDHILSYASNLQQIARDIATLDILHGFSDISQKYAYVRPEFVETDELIIEEGRHPVVERMTKTRFVPNGISLSSTTQRMMMLSGANMAGKSTYIRQVALLVIMSQIGAYVPAKLMKLGLIDQIHTRIGAMDNVSQGLSTFMVEMVETAHILHNLSDRCLVILDEVGRGTSTQDGLAIAWAITEFLHKNSQAKVLFATHYLELSTLANKLEHMGSYHMAVAEKGDEVLFLYHVKNGEASRSYGVQVARHAGIPAEVIDRAEELFADIHARSALITPKDVTQPSLFEIPHPS